jgi:signal transduction histidine kinase
MVLLAGMLLCVGLFLWEEVLERWGATQARWAILGYLLVLWQVSHWTDIPRRLLSWPIFSADKCAISPLHTSLWDVAWTMGILLWLTVFLPKRLPSFPRRVQTTFFVGGFGLLWVLFGGIFYLFVQHSQVEIDPLRQLGIEELSVWALVLFMVWRVLRLFRGGELSPWVWIGVVGLSIGVWLIGLPLWGGGALIGLYAALALERAGLRFVFQGLQAVLLVVALNAWISWGYERRAYEKLRAAAPLVVQLRKPPLEYRMARAIPQIASDSLLWQNLIIEDFLIDARFIAKIINKHLLTLSDEYDFVISCWSVDGQRIDNLFEVRPLPRKQVLPPYAEPTLAPYTYFVRTGWPRYLYVARVPVKLRDLPPIEVQIEFHPRSRPLRARLYPMEEEPSDPSYALYEGRRLIRQWGAEDFPQYLALRVGTEGRRVRTDKYYEYFYASVSGLVAYLRYPARDRAAHLATLPIFLMLLGVGLAIEHRSVLRTGWYRLYRREGPLAAQLQVLFGGLVAFSLIALVGVSFFLFWRLSQERLRQELVQRLTSVRGYLSGDPILLEKLNHWLGSYMALEESFVRDLMRRVAYLSGSEVFLYTAQGTLYSSTLPRAYWGIYAPPLLEPSAFSQISRPNADIVVTADKGEERLLGYASLRAEGGRLIGILQIPTPLYRKSFYEPLRDFIAYAVNAYLIFTLASIGVGILLLRRFSEGLERIAKQLRSAPEAANPPPLTWEGKEDEIAALVSAYNDMVERLRANQKALEATLRRVSQQEMAFQAAHEIKTALTPLKIHLQHLQRMPTVDPDKLRDISTRLLQRIEALVRIANAFMSFARLGSAEALPLTPIHLPHFLEEQTLPYRQNPPIPLELYLPEVPVWIQANPDALQQVLNNLLQNALQALEGHPTPWIRVSLQIEGHEAIIAIQDNGPGIPPEVQERIFEFYFTTRRSGTGLGLAITKGLVERMGGRIAFHSEVGAGTTFYVAFPAKMG